MTTALSQLPGIAGTELSEHEKETLQHCEEVIGKNMISVVEFGQALATIREQKLYRERYETWEQYVAQRWEIKARTSYQYIAAAGAYENVRNCAQIDIFPTNESQLRPLTRLEDQDQAQAWRQAIDTAPEGRITGRHVAQVVSKMLGEQIKAKAQTQQQQVRQSDLPDDMKDLFWNLINRVREARANNLTPKMRNDLRNRINGLLQLLED